MNAGSVSLSRCVSCILVFVFFTDMRHFTYYPIGTCSRKIDIDIDDNGIVLNISFEGGCNGNLKGLCALAKGRLASEVRSCLKGIKCGAKPTSCPDQLAKALDEVCQAR